MVVLSWQSTLCFVWKNCIASPKEKSLSSSLAAWAVKKGYLCNLGFCLPSLCDSSRLEISQFQFLCNSKYQKEFFGRLIQRGTQGFWKCLKTHSIKRHKQTKHVLKIIQNHNLADFKISFQHGQMMRKETITNFISIQLSLFFSAWFSSH